MLGDCARLFLKRTSKLYGTQNPGNKCPNERETHPVDLSFVTTFVGESFLRTRPNIR